MVEKHSSFPGTRRFTRRERSGCNVGNVRDRTVRLAARKST